MIHVVIVRIIPLSLPYNRGFVVLRVIIITGSIPLCLFCSSIVKTEPIIILLPVIGLLLKIWGSVYIALLFIVVVVVIRLPLKIRVPVCLNGRSVNNRCLFYRSRRFIVWRVLVVLRMSRYVSRRSLRILWSVFRWFLGWFGFLLVSRPFLFRRVLRKSKGIDGQ